MEKTKAKIFSALISVLQIQGLNGKTCGFLFESYFFCCFQFFFHWSFCFFITKAEIFPSCPSCCCPCVRQWKTRPWHSLTILVTWGSLAVRRRTRTAWRQTLPAAHRRTRRMGWAEAGMMTRFGSEMLFNFKESKSQCHISHSSSSSFLCYGELGEKIWILICLRIF